MENFKEKGTAWVASDKLLRLEEGIAVLINYSSTGEEVIREIVKAGDVVLSADEIFCKTDCSFSSIRADEDVKITKSQHSRMVALCLIKEERLTIDRIKMLLKHLISEYLILENTEWIPVPLELTHEQIAKLTSSTRITITRALSDLEEKNIVKRKRRKIFFNREFL